MTVQVYSDKELSSKSRLPILTYENTSRFLLSESFFIYEIDVSEGLDLLSNGGIELCNIAYESITKQYNNMVVFMDSIVNQILKVYPYTCVRRVKSLKDKESGIRYNIVVMEIFDLSCVSKRL